MNCDPKLLKSVPLFSLLDDDETAVLASQVELKTFAARERIYKRGAPGGQAYVLVSGLVRVSTLDEEGQEIVVQEPTAGEFFGFASMLEQSPHQTNAIALEDSTCIEVDRNDIIEKESTLGERVADAVAGFGGSWTFISIFGITLVVYTLANILLNKKAWDPYPFILLNLFLSMLAAIQAPVIMMSQNRQNTRDRLRSELDFDVNRRAELEIQGVAQKLNALHDKIHDMEELLRKTTNSRT